VWDALEIDSQESDRQRVVDHIMQSRGNVKLL